MKIKNFAKGAAKLVGITFVATAAIAVVTSGEALKTIGAGFQIAGEAVKKHVLPKKDESTVAEDPTEEAAEIVEETVVTAETAEEDFEA